MPVTSWGQFGNGASGQRITGIGIGIAHPGSSTLLFSQENPAGFVSIDDFKASGLVLSADSEFSNKTYAAEFGWGAKGFGFAVGASQQDNDNSTFETDPIYHWGLGVSASSIGLALGLRGRIIKGSTGNSSTEDAGLALEFSKNWSFAFVAYNVFDNLERFSTGIAYAPAKDWVTTLDVVFFETLPEKQFWLGTKLTVKNRVELSAGVSRIEPGNGASASMDPFVGVGLGLGKSWSALFQWQTFTELVASFSFQF